MSRTVFLYAVLFFPTGVEFLLLDGENVWSRFVQVDKGRILQETLTRLSRLNEGEGLLLQPYKKDRSIYVIRRENMVQVLEQGFARRQFTVETGKVKKLLRTLCKKEFPRSNKVWLNFCTIEEVSNFTQKWG